MPTRATKQRARRDARQGKKPTTQAGRFIRDEMREFKRGSGNVRSRKQAVAIGLSEARRAGVKLGAPRKAGAGVRRKAARDTAVGRGQKKVSAARSRGAKQAARTRQMRYRRSSGSR